jgi:hypothetical protein
MYMRRRLVLGSMAGAALPSSATTRKPQALKPEALLTVSGLTGRENNEAAHRETALVRSRYKTGWCTRPNPCGTPTDPIASGARTRR